MFFIWDCPGHIIKLINNQVFLHIYIYIIGKTALQIRLLGARPQNERCEKPLGAQGRRCGAWFVLADATRRSRSHCRLHGRQAHRIQRSRQVCV